MPFKKLQDSFSHLGICYKNLWDMIKMKSVIHDDIDIGKDWRILIGITQFK